MGFDIRTDRHSAERAAEQAREWLASHAPPALEPAESREPAAQIIVRAAPFRRRAPNATPETRLPAKPSLADNTFLYVVRSLHLVKIGFAANLYVRISNLRVDNPHDVELLHYTELAKAAAKQAEKMVHIAFAESWATGEWFRVSDEAAVEEAKRIAGAVTAIHALPHHRLSVTEDPQP